HDRKLSGSPDLVFPRFKAVVVVHGCFWHVHGCKYSTAPATRQEFWAEKFAANRARDERNVNLLTGSGQRYRYRAGSSSSSSSTGTCSSRHGAGKEPAYPTRSSHASRALGGIDVIRERSQPGTPRRTWPSTSASGWRDRSNRSSSSSSDFVERCFDDIADLLHQLPFGEQSIAQRPV